MLSSFSCTYILESNARAEQSPLNVVQRCLGAEPNAKFEMFQANT